MTIIDRPDGLRTLLLGIDSVAVVGVSADPRRPSRTVSRYLIDHSGWDLYFVNPELDEVFGRPVYPSLGDLPVTPDLVDVFRRTEHLPAIVDESIEVGAGAIWFQLGLVHDTAAARASAAGLAVVQDRCLQIDHARLIGRCG